MEHAKVLWTRETCCCAVTETMLCILIISILVPERSMAIRTFRKVEFVFWRGVTNDELFRSWIIDHNGILMASFAIS